MDDLETLSNDIAQALLLSPESRFVLPLEWPLWPVARRFLYLGAVCVEIGTRKGGS